jgi:hypothetical protein
MREDLLHFIWKYRKLTINLTTSKNKKLVVLHPGTHNLLSGPDFFNARLQIDDQVWAGNVEMHIRASDWYAHHHEEDDNYNSIVLHVVWEYDVPVFRKNNTEIPTLELRGFIPSAVLQKYYQLFDTRETNFINCEKDIGLTDPFVLDNWLERMYFERLEKRSEQVYGLLKVSRNDWEGVLFMLLLKNFGLKINGEAFLSLGRALEFTVVKKTRDNPLQLESILLGMSGLLDDTAVKDEYFNRLYTEYQYLKKKFALDASAVLKPEFFRLRPPNFPTIRLSQFAVLYGKHQLFSQLMETIGRKELHEILRVAASSYWDNHFTFTKVSEGNPKVLTPTFMDLLLINAILPLKFCYAREMGIHENEKLVEIISEIKNENNSIVNGFKNSGVTASCARDSQALLQLYNEYCTKNKCLHCAIGTQLLSGK